MCRHEGRGAQCLRFRRILRPSKNGMTLPGIAQPDANLIRRGLKIPKPEICMKIAKLLDKNPVELLLIAQKEKAPSSAKQYWTLALTAVDVMLHVPKTPRYIPRKVEAIGRELRQLETQKIGRASCRE